MNSGQLLPVHPVDPVILQTEAWQFILMGVFFGFLMGLITNIKTGGGSRYFTVAIAQSPYQFQEFRVPLLPRCIFGALLMALLAIGGNAKFIDAYPLFVIWLVALLTSVGIWLYAASRNLAHDDNIRNVEIQRFLADQSAAVPVRSHPPGELPGFFHVWSRINNLLFLLLTLRAALPVIAFIWRNHHIAIS